MRKTRKSIKVLSLILTVAMLVGVISVGMVAGATDYTGPGQANGYTMGDTVIVNGHKYECTGWWVTTEPPGASWTDLGAVGGSSTGSSTLESNDTTPAVDQIQVKVIPTGDKVYMGYGTATDVTLDPNGNKLRNYAPCGSFTIKQGEQYVLYMTPQIAGKWYLGTYDDCVSLKLTSTGLEVTGASYDWNGIKSASTNNYSVTCVGGKVIEIRYAANSGNKNFSNGDLVGSGSSEPREDGVIVHDGSYYVSDTTLNDWAKVNHDLALSVDGAARQAFSVNSVKNLLAAWGAPARTKNVEFNKQETKDYYNQSKVDNAQYMKHETYQYSEYFLHDYYAQGVWDAMPATYGWMQDEYTTPGKVLLHKNPEVNGLAYAIALGGQNPYILCDYLERYANKVTDGTYKNSVAVNGPDNKTVGNAAGWFAGYDEVAEVPYLWNPDEGIFLGYENTQSWKARADYINEKGLGGVIIWEISGDDKQKYDMTNIFKDELKAKGKQVIAYFCNWSVYNDYHQRQTPADLPWEALTVVNYSFFQIGGYDTGTKDTTPTALSANEVHTIDAWADDYGSTEGGDPPSMLLEMEEYAAKYPDVKCMFSIGGWTRGDGFAEAVETAANRQTLINSIIAFMNKYTFFDGVDLDWEYPGVGSREADFDDCADMGCPNSSNDFKNYADFVAELRTALDSNFKSSGRNMITACFPGAPEKLAKQDVVRLGQTLDYLNMMTYDYHGAFDPTIGYNNPLYAHPETPDEWCTDNTVKAILGYGVPASKVNIGAGLYSRGWAGVIPDADMNPAPLQDPTPIFGTTEGKEIVMKFDATKAYVDGSVYPTTQYATGYATLTNVNGTAMMPLRYIAEVSGFDVAYDEATQKTKVTNKANGEYLLVTPGSTSVAKYSSTGALLGTTNAPSAFAINNGVTMGPLRYTCEALGMFVNYQETNHGIYVTVTSASKTTDEALALIEKAYGMGL